MNIFCFVDVIIMFFRQFVFFGIFLSFLSWELYATDGDVPPRDADAHYVSEQLENVGIDEKVGKTITKDIAFVDQNGKKVVLADYFQDKKPVLLSFAYFSCPSLCHFVVDAKQAAIEKISLQGSDYRAITISFDERDKPEDAKRYHERYTSKFKNESFKNEFNWDFLVGTKEANNQIAGDIGFNFKWLPDKKEFAHAAAMYVLSPTGKVSRYFYGLYFSPFDLKMALLEAKDEKYRSSLEKILLYCYRYDSEARGYVANAWLLMRLGGAFTALAIAFFLYVMFRYERKRSLLINKKEGKS